ncbi:MAG: hypothetical protein ABIQ43_09130 [Sphingomonas sp.]
MPRALKVFCTPIGFHDAYVAAPSRKAALEAWGADANLFARGMAAVVTDPALTKEPLAKPGQVIKRVRGTTEQHLAALPKSPTPRSAPAPTASDKTAKPVRPKPKPGRRKLGSAEQALQRAEGEYAKAADAIRDREETLRRERQQLNAKRDAELARLQRKLDDVRADYDDAMEAWRD